VATSVLTRARWSAEHVFYLSMAAAMALTVYVGFARVALVAWDKSSRGRLHPATVWGGALFVLSQPLRLAISATPAWMAFAEWVVGSPL